MSVFTEVKMENLLIELGEKRPIVDDVTPYERGVAAYNQGENLDLVVLRNYELLSDDALQCRLGWEKAASVNDSDWDFEPCEGDDWHEKCPECGHRFKTF